MLNKNANRLTIGQMADLNRVSVQTLRYYERLGLITPKLVDQESNYRYYDLEQSSILDIIKYLKNCDLSLSEIKSILSAQKVDTVSTIALLEQRKNCIDKEVNELIFKKSAIDSIIDSLEMYQQLPQMGTILLEHFPKRNAFVYQGKTNYYQNPTAYEQGLLELKQAMERYDLPHFFSLNPAAITRKQFLQPNKLFCNELFVYVDKPYTKDRLPLVEIPGGTYLCIYCDDVLDEEHYLYKLLDNILENHIEIIGDCIEESISDITAIKSNRHHLIMRIKIPVRFQHYS